MKLVLVAVLMAGMAGGGTFWFSSRRVSAQGKKPAAKASPEVKEVLHLDSFLVNLSDQDTNSFFRAGIDLGMSKPLPDAAKGDASQSKYMPMIRDTILDIIGRCSSAALLAPDGKQNLKAQILAALHKRFPGMGFQDVYFTDFLIQR
ncbi:MAG: flagellar basal body-associated FliL family protein [Terriglobia bacterium]